MKIDRTIAESKTYGRLRIVGWLPRPHKMMMVRCVCSCGTEKLVRWAHVRDGITVSCGCFHKEQQITHGMTNTPEYRVWDAMVQRCGNPKCKYFGGYGGRGIVVCAEWWGFANFYKDMGPRPTPQHTIERIDNDKGYGPSNCRWATRADQMRNTRRTRFVDTPKGRMCVTDAERAFGVSHKTIHKRMAAGESMEQVFRPAPMRGRKIRA